MAEVEEKQKKRRKRRKSIPLSALLAYKPKVVQFDGPWIIYGQSGQGKSCFVIKLIKYFALKDYKILCLPVRKKSK